MIDYYQRRINLFQTVEGILELETDDDSTIDNEWADDKQFSKVYVVIQNGKVLYVGETVQLVESKLESRLNKNPNAKYSYPYTWAREGNFDVFAFKIGERPENTSQRTDHIGLAVEAEVVLQIRINTGQWPLNQTEIHFSNFESSSARAKAGYIWSIISGSL